MAEENVDIPAFDPTLKKKKKKKVELDLDGAADESAEGAEELSLDDPNAMFGKKKKKKSKDVDTSLEDTSLEDDTGLGDLTSKKKKKKKKALDLDGLEEMDAEDADEKENAPSKSDNGLPWEGSTRDYHYDEMLGRVFGMLLANNPELAGEKQKTILKPPQVLREGTKKTVFVNFMELCKAMHRQPEHVMGYLHAELGTSGSLDGQQRLIMKGRFTPKVFEGILRRYVNEYVICNMCKSTDTLLSREQRLFILRCQPCGASRSVGAIKAGFVAQVGRRKRA
eukprot:CAMPEP_0198212666 /NCGR_PEP_ID=MMETSP1445-20131203/27092_1 /TAXON_ID=36898 /ORGANISM="Pyramimonas sp., Strain CCMP2087" /LENGTH=280 /DNA_ID=CAMNT_0043887171 /DNA_START=159 /DNA_END=1001 /DNA_ORIENTATION=-